MWKRIFDLVVSCLLLAVFSPLMAVVAIMVLATMGRPVLFVQLRPGLGGRLFKIYKFRTMNVTRDDRGRLVPDGERLTLLGRFLRMTSLDELPELVNVIAGDMSLVGPRPLLTEYLPLYTPAQARRHKVRPGITGWAQVNGRQNIAFSQRLEYDVWYVDHMSIGLDIRILFRTLIRVATGEGVKSGQDVREVDDLGFSEFPKKDRNQSSAGRKTS